ncbi:cytochrome B [Mucilaginibacter jinjuensis]|uniref:Cytochrome B n=1 Tax=Mucilaginibacter jinjuensis TaxID=1176721 RepID=A0ABY7T832_9SPHI|nr:cytochrome B [Mucilaginibacter jinjuensis]WCT12036.1 cytochrome B [Mucilaginibacter jinjuensis]
MNAYTIFKYIHSGLRFIVVILLLWAIIQSLAGWFGKKSYTEGNRKVNLFAMISAHTQLLFGIVLYFLSPFVQFGANTMKDATTRYWTVEHISMMIIALVVITIGHAKSKRANTPEAKHKTIAIFYIIAVIIVVVALSAGHVPLLGMSA